MDIISCLCDGADDGDKKNRGNIGSAIEYDDEDEATKRKDKKN